MKKIYRPALSSFFILLPLFILFSGCNSKEESMTFKYSSFRGKDDLIYYEISSAEGNLSGFEIPVEYKGRPVECIADEAFSGLDMLHAGGDSIKLIRCYAFENCRYLDDISFPKLEAIQTGAFMGCLNLWEVYFPSSLKTIGAYAFGGCYGLRDVYFMGLPESIGINAFGDYVTLHGPAGSVVEEYANKYGLEFVEWYMVE